MALAKLRFNQPLFSTKVPINKRVLVIGGGVAGIQAALDCAEGDLEVVLVEREPTIGGKMAKLDKTFPTVDCSSCILGPKMVDTAQKENIKLYAASEVASVSGYVGNFKVEIRKKATYVNWQACTGCGQCVEKCPSGRSPTFSTKDWLRPVPSTSPFLRPSPKRRPSTRPTASILRKGSVGSAKRSVRSAPLTTTCRMNW